MERTVDDLTDPAPPWRINTELSEWRWVSRAAHSRCFVLECRRLSDVVSQNIWRRVTRHGQSLTHGSVQSVSVGGSVVGRRRTVYNTVVCVFNAS